MSSSFTKMYLVSEKDYKKLDKIKLRMSTSLKSKQPVLPRDQKVHVENMERYRGEYRVNSKVKAAPPRVVENLNTHITSIRKAKYKHKKEKPIKFIKYK